MTDKLPTPEERAFLESIGLEPNDLTPLVADAPLLPADTLARIRDRAHAKAGADASMTSVATAVPVKPPARPRRSRGRWLAAAAAALLMVGGTLFVTNPQGALAAIQRLVRLVPGIGLTETDAETLVMASPVSAESGGERLTVTGLISQGKQTEVRFLVEGLPLDKKEPDVQAAFKPTLQLADGTVLQSHSSSASGGSGTAEGVIWFGPLPSGTSSVTLLLPPVHGMTQPFELAIPVVDAGSAGLTEAVAGAWSEERLGVRIGVPHWTVQGDLIVLNLEAELPRGTAVEHFLAEHVLPELSDEQGRVYPLVHERSNLSPNPGESASLTFQGPLAPDADRLRLTVPAIKVVEEAEVELSIPLAQLPEGQPLDLDEEMEIGSQRFVIHTVTRLDEGTFRFALNLGPEEEGALLQGVEIAPRAPFFRSGGYSTTGRMNQQSWQLERLDYSPEKVPDRNLELVFKRPLVRLQGDWVVGLPEIR